MAQNPDRRRALLDAGLTVLASEGSRGLTHRAVDDHAGVPRGTCANYFRSRDALLFALGERIFERLTPSTSVLAASADHPPSRARYAALMHELMTRVLDAPDLQLALFELRLASTRNSALAASLTQTLRGALELDVAFHEQAGLPGGRREVVLLHLAFEGLIWNTLTLPGVLEVEGHPEIVETLVHRLIP